jgi:hypothetical protein
MIFARFLQRPVMFRLLRCMLKSLMSTAQTHHALAIENLALRQQLAVLNTSVKRPRLSITDRAFWVFASRWWPSWRAALILVKPQTVVAWHRKGFRLFGAFMKKKRSAQGQRRDPRPGATDGSGERRLGSAAHPW